MLSVGLFQMLVNCPKITVFNLRIRIPQLLTILILKIEQVKFPSLVDEWQTVYTLMGLHCLLNSYVKYDITNSVLLTEWVIMENTALNSQEQTTCKYTLIWVLPLVENDLPFCINTWSLDHLFVCKRPYSHVLSMPPNWNKQKYLKIPR